MVGGRCISPIPYTFIPISPEGVINWFRKKSTDPGVQLTADLHSHLLPGLDDGVKTLEESESIIKIFQQQGYKKLITTPHVMQDHYRNTPETIRTALRNLQEYMAAKDNNIIVEAAAEYYLDEYLMKQIDSGEELLTFGSGYLLFETNFISEPLNLNDFIFLATTKGLKLVMAHPERYVYLQRNPKRIEDLIDRGVYFQLNVPSLAGAYSKPVQSLAHQLIDRGFVHFIGSDCHHMLHVKLLEQVRKSRYFKKALTLPLLNNSL